MIPQEMRNALARLKEDEKALLGALQAAGARTGPDRSHLHCPFHAGGTEDRTGSLSVFEDVDGGGWRWRCHQCEAGGDIVDVVAKSERLDSGAAIRRALEVYGGVPPMAVKPTAKSTEARKPRPFPELGSAAKALEPQNGPCTRQDVYTDAAGNDVMAVLRFDPPGGGKTCRPLTKRPEGWVVGDPKGRLPLFNLPNLLANPQAPVVVVEGEKCAEAVANMGLLATTSAHGASAALKSDWTPLAGRDVVIWPDNDNPGRQYMESVTEALQALDPPATVYQVNVAGFDSPEGWDVADFVSELEQLGDDQEKIRSALKDVLTHAQEVPHRWVGGVDLSACSAVSRLSAVETFKPKACIPTGFAQLDGALGGGWGEGETTTLFGPSGTGKSSVMVNLALSAARQGIPTAIISLEMREADIWQLAVASTAGIPRQHIRKGTLSEPDGLRFQGTLGELSGWPLYVVDRSRFPVDEESPEAPTMQAIARVLREGVRFCKWRLVFIDYLMKVGPFEGDDLVRLPRLTSWVFDLAQRLGVHVVALAQTGKSSWGRTDGSGVRTVGLEDSKGGIENVADFDAAIGLVRDDWNTEKQEDSPIMRAVVLKARHAAGGVCRFTFHRVTGRIEEAPPEKLSFAEMAGALRKKREPAGTEDELLACFPAAPAPKAVILLRADEAGIPKARADGLLAQAVHDGHVFRARIDGQQLYARTKESLEALVKPKEKEAPEPEPPKDEAPAATEPEVADER